MLVILMTHGLTNATGNIIHPWVSNCGACPGQSLTIKMARNDCQYYQSTDLPMGNSRRIRTVFICSSILSAYAWPGNRRTLAHYFVVMRGKLILMSCTPPAVITNIMIMDLNLTAFSVTRPQSFLSLGGKFIPIYGAFIPRVPVCMQ